MDESSGLAWSRTRDGVWFTHNDAGGQAEVYAFQLDGTSRGAHVVEGAGFRDWEDLSSGPCPGTGDPCLYVGDIGDNGRIRESITVYAFAEPAEGAATTVLATWTATYPDGAHDAESLAVHPCSGRIYLVTKDRETESVVYRFPEAPDTKGGGPSVLEEIARLPTQEWSPASSTTTGADWDPDGERFILRTYGTAWLWETDPANPDAHWATTPQSVILPSGGEAVAFGPEGAIWTTREGVPMSIGSVDCEGLDATGQCPGADTAPPADTGADDDTAAYHDTAATADTAASTGPPPAREEQACGCRGGAAWLLLPPLAWRRRRGQRPSRIQTAP